MTKAIIVDDEQHCIDRLERMLAKNHTGSISLMGKALNVKDGLKLIDEVQPDVVFLDVQIKDRTGFDLLRETAVLNFKVIFCTAYEHYAIQAIKFSAIDYLLKPIDEDDLSDAILKINIETVENTRKKANVIEYNATSPKKKITVPSGNQLLFLNLDEIFRCQSDINYTTIYLTDNKKIVVAKTLKEFEELLCDFHFFRIHNSEIINLDYIKAYNKGKGGAVILTDGTELEVSTRRKDDFLKKMNLL
jgi:two-component system, LytTR family, response regulator